MLNVQRRLAAQILKCGKHSIRFDTGRLEEIKESITKTDIKALIGDNAIFRKKTNNTSRFWSRKRKYQKSRGKQKGFGSRKGKKTARSNPKRIWINKIRLQRGFIKSLRDKGMIASADYHELYSKSKGGFFRSLRHLRLYVNEKGLLKNEIKKQG